MPDLLQQGRAEEVLVAWLLDEKPFEGVFAFPQLLIATVLLSVCIRLAGVKPELPAVNTGLRARRLAAVIGSALAFSAALHAPLLLVHSLSQDSRILIDDAHCDWELTDLPFDTSTYGRRSTYNYRCFAEILGRYYDVDTNSASKLSSNLLDSYDLVVLKTPTRDFDPDEIASAQSYVKGGGRLLLLGDHTDLFGMNTRLNSVSTVTNTWFVSDNTYEMFTGDLLSWFRPVIAPVHPALTRVRSLRFATTCTVNSPILNDDILCVGRMGADYLDLANPGFFSNVQFDAKDKSGAFVLCTAANYKWCGQDMSVQR